jgi:hypothetical protein
MSVPMSICRISLITWPRASFVQLVSPLALPGGLASGYGYPSNAEILYLDLPPKEGGQVDRDKNMQKRF